MSDAATAEGIRTSEALEAVEESTKPMDHEILSELSDLLGELKISEISKTFKELAKYAKNDKILYKMLLNEEDRCEPPASTDVAPSLP